MLATASFQGMLPGNNNMKRPDEPLLRTMTFSLKCLLESFKKERDKGTILAIESALPKIYEALGCDADTNWGDVVKICRAVDDRPALFIAVCIVEAREIVAKYRAMAQN